MDQLRDYGQDLELIKQFFRDYTHVDENGEIVPLFAEELTRLANREQRHMLLDLTHLEKFNQELAYYVTKNTSRYQQLFLEALDELLPAYKTKEVEVRDIMDVFTDQRLFISDRNQKVQGPSGPTTQQQQADKGYVDINERYPPDLVRRVELTFKPSHMNVIPIREVKSDYMGRLLTIRGIVTRVTDVRPRVTVQTYTCDQCGCESFQEIKSHEFTPLVECTSRSCTANKTLGRLTMQIRGSKFVKYQEIKLQEHSDQVPVGHIPRCITASAYGEMTRQCSPGDHISISGVYLPLEKSAYRARTGGLSADSYIEVHYLTQMNKTEDAELNVEPMSSQEAADLIGNSRDFLKRLVHSIAPEIYGHDELKKALLLLLVGGVDKSPNGMRIRGNINICIMGDPGVAKSQLLSFIDRLAPRSKYYTKHSLKVLSWRPSCNRSQYHIEEYYSCSAHSRIY